MTSLRVHIKLKTWLLLCIFISIHSKCLADVVAHEAKPMVIKFGTRSELLKTDGTGGTYSYEKKYFRSGGSFSLEISRDPAFNIMGAVDFHIKVLSMTSKGRSVADRIVTQRGNEKVVTTFKLFGRGPHLVRIRLDGDIRKVMEGQLFPARIEPSLPPASFFVEARPIGEGGDITLVDKESFDKFALNLSNCDLGATPRRESAELERISSVGPAAALTKVPTVKLFGAGQEVYLSIPSSWRKAGRRIYIKIEAKRFDDSSYRIVCKPFLLSRTDGYVLARLVTQGEWLNWRVETRFERSDGGFHNEEAITINRERFISPPPMSAAGTDFGRALSFICFDRKTSDVTSLGESDFAKSFYLDIQVRQSEFKVSESQLRDVERLSLDVASAWNRACINCQALNLSIISFNGKNFIHSAVGQWVRSKLLTPLDAEYINMSLRVAKGNNRIGTTGLSFSYQPIGDIRMEFEDVCRIQELPSHSSLSILKRQVCNEESRKQNYTTNILIDFVEGKTACGNDPNIIACRADNELTEFNVRDFKFILSDASAPSIGNGKIEVDFAHVLLHEMGHWVGLGHIDSDDSAMAPSMEQSRCIDAVTVERLNKVVASEIGNKSSPLAFMLEKRPREVRGVGNINRSAPRK